MHVLLPAVLPSHVHGMPDMQHDDDGGLHTIASPPEIPAHLPRLIYDRAHENPNARQFLRSLQCLPLDQKALTLSGPTASGFDPFLTTEIADLKGIVGGLEVSRELVGNSPGPAVGARVTLQAGRVTDCEMGPVAKLDGNGLGFSRLTSLVEWTIRGFTSTDFAGRSSLALTLTGLNGTSTVRLPRLYPIGDAVIVEVWNAPENDLPGSGLDPTENGAEHFAIFYDLYDPDFTKLPDAARSVPILADLQPAPLSTCFPPDQGGGPIVPGTQTCMGSQGQLAPPSGP
jgi:hypothetical protein